MAELSKLDQGNALSQQIAKLAKEIDLYKRIIKLSVDTTGVYPSMGLKVNPEKSSDVVWLNYRYAPIDSKGVADAYIKNMEDHKAGLQSELDNLFN